MWARSDNSLLDVGTVSYLEQVRRKRESTSQNFRLWAKFVF